MKTPSIDKITLRDFFASNALPAVIKDWLHSGDIAQDHDIVECIARDCYIVADAMIEERKREAA